MDASIHLSVVSPVYGAPDLVVPLLDRLEPVLRGLTDSFEVVLVNDACPFGSWDRIREAAASRPWLVGINLSRNFGQHYAITAGLDHARGEWVVVMDCDLQDQPEEIPKLMAKAREGFDAVFGRRHDRQDSWIKTLPGDLFLKLYDWLSGTTNDRTVANFSLSRRVVIDAVRQYRERDRSFPRLVAMAGFRIGKVDVNHAARPSGRSGYNLRKLLSLALQIVVSGSNKPLRLSIKFGAFVALCSVLYTGFLIYRYYQAGVAVAGWTTIAVLITLFSGLLFMQLGIIGLYLGKVFDETKRRPLYHVADLLNRDPDA